MLGLILGQAVALHLMGRVWICSCGTVRLWVGDIHSPELSQQVLDWYTPSHFIHGMIFYGLLHLALPRTPVLARLAIAVGLEAAWEIAENSPFVIEAYRKQALAAGYVGDSILNSLMDTVSMMAGFTLAWLLPWPATVALAVIAEIATGVLIHDNLTLNILNFIHRFPAIDAWQRGV
ncbi:MAG: DUF2585 family protein [Proteobacteria bacterium]|nr:DUF2585 family protein [Pseudomonadota bacterium]